MRDIQTDLIDQALSAAIRPHKPVGVSVMVHSQDPDMIAQAGPRLARLLYPGRRFGAVLWHEPADDFALWPGERVRVARAWSEVVVEDLGAER